MGYTRMHSASALEQGRPLAGKVAIITGASRGIGAAAALAFGRAGASVVLAARDEMGLERIAQQVRETGSEAFVVATDAGDHDAVERLVRRTLDTFGRLDAAFNNAGEGHTPAPLADITIEDFDRTMRTNARGVFLAMKHEIPAMLANGGGAIVNMSSTAGLAGARGIASYVASKHAIIGLTKTAALDYAGRNIRVNAVAPGPILTDRLRGLPDETRDQVARHVPMGQLGRPEEVGAVAVWLCSDQASFITGATFPIDGGRLAGGA